MRFDLHNQRRTRLPILGKLAGSQEQSGSAITQHIGVFNLLALQLRHRHRIHLGRRRLAAFQQLACVLAFGVGTAEVFPKTPGFKLHFGAALVALQGWTFITLDSERTLLHFIAGTIRVVTAHMEFATFVHQVTVHGRSAFRATPLLSEQTGFTFAIDIFVRADNLVTGHQVDGRFAPFFRRQGVP